MGMRKTVWEIRHTCRIKRYPGDAGYYEIMASDRPVFRESGWEPTEDPRGGKKPPKAKKSVQYDNLERAARRAQVRVRDLALSNKWDYFVTLTLDRDRIDRYDMAAITKALRVWCDNRVRRDGLRYVLVPERHKDGAIHFHGLFAGVAGVESGTYTAAGWRKPRRPRSAAQLREWQSDPDTYHPVYNLPAWTYGYTTAIPLYGPPRRAVEYVCKYIGKQGDKPGGRWYYHGGDLKEPQIEYCDLDFREIEALEGAYCFTVDAARAAFAVVRGEGYADDIGRVGVAADAQL